MRSARVSPSTSSHDEELLAVHFFQSKERRDVGMVQGSKKLCLPHEAV